MNAPQLIPEARHLNIALDLLVPSPTNPRKRFDEAKLQELASSIEVQGILQPILVREFHFFEPPDNTVSYEIIAGERRYRAAKIAGLAEIPCIVRQLTDQQVLHAQVIENLQRDDLHELEEAEGYERLLKETDAAGQPCTVDTIAAEVGKSRAYVYGRLKLLALCADARQAFYDAKIDASTALLIARIPTQQLQLQCLEKVLKGGYDDGAMSFRAARDHIHDNFMLELSKAPWSPKDAALLPKAGACATCPKLTGNQPGLFDDVKSKNVCTDTVCFAMKKTAHVLVLQKKAEAEGHKVIVAKEAKKLIPEQYYGIGHQLQKHGLTPLTEAIPNDPNGTTWEKALAKAKLLAPKNGAPAVQKTILENPYHAGEIIQTINIEEATKALREAGFEIKLKGTASPEKLADKKRQEKEKAAVAPENAYRQKLFDELRAAIGADFAAGQIRPELFLVLAQDAVTNEKYDNDTVKGLIARHAPELASLTTQEARFEAFAKKLPELTSAQHLLIVFELQMNAEREIDIWAMKRSDRSTPYTMLRIAQIQGVDTEAVRAVAMAEHEAALKAEKEAAAAAKQKPAKAAAKEPAKAKPATPPKPTKAARWPFPTPNYDKEQA